MKEAGIKLIQKPVSKIDLENNKIISLRFSDNKPYCVDTIYSALGCIKNNKLALDLGAKHKKGELVVNEYQQTSIKGLYAAGDIVSGVNQICVAQGQAAIAAVNIHKQCKLIK